MHKAITDFFEVGEFQEREGVRGEASVTHARTHFSGGRISGIDSRKMLTRCLLYTLKLYETVLSAATHTPNQP